MYIHYFYIYPLFHGIPSGVKPTSILGSRINLIALNYCISDFNYKDFFFFFFGDEFLRIDRCRTKRKSRLKSKILNRCKEISMIFKFFYRKNNLHEKRIDFYPTFYNIPYI